MGRQDSFISFFKELFSPVVKYRRIENIRRRLHQFFPVPDEDIPKYQLLLIVLFTDK